MGARPFSVRSYFSNMQVQLTAEEETRLAELAARGGRTTGDLVQEVVKRYIEDDAKFIAAVIKGLASLDRGEFISHEEVGKRIDRLFSTDAPMPPRTGKDFITMPAPPPRPRATPGTPHSIEDIIAIGSPT
jgi:predicted transcriptional regulator